MTIRYHFLRKGILLTRGLTWYSFCKNNQAKQRLPRKVLSMFIDITSFNAYIYFFIYIHIYIYMLLVHFRWEFFCYHCTVQVRSANQLLEANTDSLCFLPALDTGDTARGCTPAQWRIFTDILYLLHLLIICIDLNFMGSLSRQQWIGSQCMRTISESSKTSNERKMKVGK